MVYGSASLKGVQWETIINAGSAKMSGKSIPLQLRLELPTRNGRQDAQNSSLCPIDDVDAIVGGGR